MAAGAAGGVSGTTATLDDGSDTAMVSLTFGAGVFETGTAASSDISESEVMLMPQWFAIGRRTTNLLYDACQHALSVYSLPLVFVVRVHLVQISL